MAVTSSPRFGLTRWSAPTDPQTRLQQDASHAAIDLLAARVDSFANLAARPAASISGRFGYDVATGLLYYDNGTVWASVGTPSGAIIHQATSGQVLPLITWKDAAGTVTVATLGVDGRLRILPPPSAAMTAAATAEFGSPTGDSRVALGGRAAADTCPAITLYTRNIADGTGTAFRFYTAGAASELIVAASSSGPTTAYGAETYAERLRVGRGDTTADVALRVKGIASQSGALQRWDDSAGAQVAALSIGGALDLAAGVTAAGTVQTPLVAATGGSAAAEKLTVTGTAAQSADLATFRSNAAAILAKVSSAGVLTAAGLVTAGAATLDRAVANPASAASIPLTAKGAASQTASLQEWQNSAGTMLAKVAADGTVTAPNIDGGTGWTGFTGTVWDGSTGAPGPVIGNGVFDGRYKQIGKTVHFRMGLTMGTTTTYGVRVNWYLGCPPSLPSNGALPNSYVQVVAFRSGSVTPLMGVGIFVGSSSMILINLPSLTAPTLAGANPTYPWTWATGDQIIVWGTYQTA